MQIRRQVIEAGAAPGKISERVFPEAQEPQPEDELWTYDPILGRKRLKTPGETGIPVAGVNPLAPTDPELLNALNYLGEKFLSGYTGGVSEALLKKYSPVWFGSQYQGKGAYNVVMRTAGKLANLGGFIMGMPMKLGEFIAAKTFTSAPGRRVMTWLGEKVAPKLAAQLARQGAKRVAMRIPSIVQSAHTLGVAFALSDNEDILKIVEDKNFTLPDLLYDKTKDYLSGMATGAQFGVIGSLFRSYLGRAIWNIGIAETLLALKHGEDARVEDYVYEAALNAWFSRHKTPLTEEQEKMIRRLIDTVVDYHRKTGEDVNTALVNILKREGIEVPEIEKPKEGEESAEAGEEPVEEPRPRRLTPVFDESEVKGVQTLTLDYSEAKLSTVLDDSAGEFLEKVKSPDYIPKVLEGVRDTFKLKTTDPNGTPIIVEAKVVGWKDPIDFLRNLRELDIREDQRALIDALLTSGIRDPILVVNQIPNYFGAFFYTNQRMFLFTKEKIGRAMIAKEDLHKYTDYFLHEYVHAVTSLPLYYTLIGEPLPPAAKRFAKEVIDLYDYSKKTVETLAKAGVYPGVKEFYGFRDPEEFIAEAFTNTEFRKLLSDIGAPGHPPVAKDPASSVWQRFKNVVKRYIQSFTKVKSPYSVLDRILDLTTEYFETPEYRAAIGRSSVYDFYFKHTVPGFKSRVPTPEVNVERTTVPKELLKPAYDLINGLNYPEKKFNVENEIPNKDYLVKPVSYRDANEFLRSLVARVQDKDLKIFIERLLRAKIEDPVIFIERFQDGSAARYRPGRGILVSIEKLAEGLNNPHLMDDIAIDFLNAHLVSALYKPLETGKGIEGKVETFSRFFSDLRKDFKVAKTNHELLQTLLENPGIYGRLLGSDWKIIKQAMSDYLSADYDIVERIVDSKAEPFPKAKMVEGEERENQRRKEILEELSKATGFVWEYDAERNEFRQTDEKYEEPEREMSEEVESVKNLDDLQKARREAENLLADIFGDFVKPSDREIVSYLDAVFGPEFVLRNDPDALKLAGKAIEADLYFRYQVGSIDAPFFEKQLHKLGGFVARRIAATRLRTDIEHVYNYDRWRRKLKSFMDTEITDAEKKASIYVGKLRSMHPERFEVANNIIKWFADMREHIKNYRRRMLKALLPEEHYKLFEEAVSLVRSGEGKIVPKEQRFETYEKLFEKYEVKNKKTQNKLVKAVEDYIDIDFWGLDDYVTRIERGTWKVIDQDDVVRAVALTRAEAQKKASELRRSGDITGAVKIVNEYSKVDPMEKTKKILKGEKNLFKALYSYSYSIRKRLVLDPLTVEMEKEFANNPNITPSQRAVIRRQLRAIKGTYGWEDRFFDTLFEKFFKSGGRPFRFSRFTSKVRSIWGSLKLGYRLVSVAVNGAFGHGHTVSKTGLQYWIKAIKWLRTPEGERFIEMNKPYLGVAYSSEMGVRGKLKAYHPLFLFSSVEPGIRKVSLAANYLMLKDGILRKGFFGLGTKKGEIDDATAVIMARRAMRAQAFVYNAASLPRMLRTPLGRFVGLFRSYLVQEAQFMSSLSGAEALRYFTFMMLTGGPQAMITFLRSLPLLGHLGILDKMELELSKWKTSWGGYPGYGIPGLLGFDISVSAIAQLPETLADWAGVIFSDIIKFYKKLTSGVPFTEEFGIKRILDAKSLKGVAAGITEAGRDWITEFIYLNDFISSIYNVDEDGTVWAYGKNGKSYPISPPGDYWKLLVVAAGLAAGAKPVEKTKIQVLTRIQSRRLKKVMARREALFDRIIRLYSSGELTEEKFDELVPNMVELGIDANAVIESYKAFHTDPKLKVYLRTLIIERPRLLDEVLLEHFKDFEETFNKELKK